jgi:hypothetical protein
MDLSGKKNVGAFCENQLGMLGLFYLKVKTEGYIHGLPGSM